MGRVLTQLNASGYANSTITVLMSDHGYALGEHNQFAKYSADEIPTRVPLIIAVPSQPHAAGLRSPALFELVDLYPTLAALAGAPAPTCGGGGGGCDGEDRSNLWAAPLSDGGKSAAFSMFPRCAYDMSYDPPPTATSLDAWWRAGGRVRPYPCGGKSQTGTWYGYMGYSIRTIHWRLTAWVFASAGSGSMQAESMRPQPQ